MFHFVRKVKVNTYEWHNLGIICCYLNYNDIKILSDGSDTSTFNSYTLKGFGKQEQVRLTKVFRELSGRKCFVMLSNHNTKLVYELYGGFNIHLIEANRNNSTDGMSNY